MIASVLDSIAENMVGVACVVFVFIPLVAMLAGVFRQRRALKRDQEDPTWASLTKGGLTDARRGELWTFWGSGRTSRTDGYAAKPTNLIAIDEVAFVFVLLQLWPEKTRRAWVRREGDGPVLLVQATWRGLGCRITEPGSGLQAEPRGLKAAVVAQRLRDLGWPVHEVEPARRAVFRHG